MYGTRPWYLVQAITRHTCLDPHLGSWNCLPHQAHIAPSELMSSIDQQGSSLGSFPTFPSPLIGLWAFDLVSSRVWWEAATNKQFFDQPELGLNNQKNSSFVLWEPYPSYYNELFSPLLVQRFHCQKGRSLSVLYKQYNTSYLLCNSIFLV